MKLSEMYEMVPGRLYAVTDRDGVCVNMQLQRLIKCGKHTQYEFDTAGMGNKSDMRQLRPFDIVDIFCTSKLCHKDGRLITAEEWLHDATLEPGARIQASRPTFQRMEAAA